MPLLTKEKTIQVFERLKEIYPDAKCALNFTNSFELLIATILSAQCTDVRVNMVTERLFRKYRNPLDYAQVEPEILQEDIKELGLFRAKAENIVACARMLLGDYRGKVPETVEELTSLPGVGRKTANVVLSNAFGVPALAVDTHVQRVSNRIGLAKSDNPLETEKQLCRRMPRELWSLGHHLLIHHGRQICTARSPKCGECPIQEFCQAYPKIMKERAKSAVKSTGRKTSRTPKN